MPATRPTVGFAELTMGRPTGVRPEPAIGPAHRVRPLAGPIAGSGRTCGPDPWLNPRCGLSKTPPGLRSQAEHVQHGSATLVIELRRRQQLRAGGGARPGCDRDILFAIDLECHRRRSEPGADIDLP